jgi:hypothetical protein
VIAVSWQADLDVRARLKNLGGPTELAAERASGDPEKGAMRLEQPPDWTVWKRSSLTPAWGVD